MEVVNQLMDFCEKIIGDVNNRFRVPLKLIVVLLFLLVVNSFTDWYYYHNLTNKIETVQGINAILKDSTMLSSYEREGLKQKRIEVLTHYSFSERVLFFCSLSSDLSLQYVNGAIATMTTNQQQNTTITALKVKPKQVKINSKISIKEMSFWNRLIYTSIPTVIFILSMASISIKNKQEKTKILVFTNIIILCIIFIITLFFNFLIPIVAPNALYNPLLNIGYSFFGFVMLVFCLSGIVKSKAC